MARRIVLWSPDLQIPSIFLPTTTNRKRPLADARLVVTSLWGGSGSPPEILDVTGNPVRGEDGGLDWSHKYQLSKPMEFVAGNFQLFPRASRTDASVPTSSIVRASTLSGVRPGSAVGLGKSSVSPGGVGTASRSKSFRELLLQRDRRCVVTGVTSLNRLKACHIIPYSSRNSLHNFPSDVREALARNIGGVDGVRNGLLMTEMLNTAFDNLEVTLVPDWTGGEASDYRLFVVVPDATTTKLHGAKVIVPDGTDEYGEPWANQFPDPALFRFHFMCAMVRYCRGESAHLEDLSRDEVTDLKVSGAGDGENLTDD